MLAARTIADLPEVSQLRRSGDDKMLAGVDDGIARYLNADITLVRVIIAALFTGAGVAVYIAAWLLTPGTANASRPPRRSLIRAAVGAAHPAGRPGTGHAGTRQNWAICTITVR